MKIDDEAVLKALATAMTDDAFKILLGALLNEKREKNTLYRITGDSFKDGQIFGEVHQIDIVVKDLLDIQKQIHTLEAKKK